MSGTVNVELKWPKARSLFCAWGYFCDGYIHRLPYAEMYRLVINIGVWLGGWSLGLLPSNPNQVSAEVFRRVQRFICDFQELLSFCGMNRSRCNANTGGK